MSSIVKVDTIQENTSANGITVDGLNIKDSKLVTANSVVAANITADAIDATKIADGSIENEHLNVLAVTGHTAETSIADGDTILIHDASASALRKMTKANFVSGIGGTNTPLIQVSLQTAAQTIADNSQTKIAYNYVQQNVGGTWDATNYRWTPGTAGKYFITMSTMISADSDNDLSHAYNVIKMNGTIEFYFGNVNNMTQGYGRTHQPTGSVILTMDTDDYIECFALLNTVSGNNGRLDGELKQTWLTAYKIIT
jgi:hypothetical protein